jgi:long-chain acyl-CoA synthetase
MPPVAHLFITGVSGSVGVEIVRWLAVHQPDTRITCLIRASSPAHLADRWRQIAGATEDSRENGHQLPAHCDLLIGDVTFPDLGISDHAARQLSETVTHIIHGAANVNFLAPVAVSRDANVTGTLNVLEFACRCRRLAQFAHVSSAFVAGKRTGIIRENELEHSAGFVNTYEQTKYEAELLVHEYMGRLPIAVYRLALLAGRAIDGYVHDPGAFHMGLRSVLEGPYPCYQVIRTASSICCRPTMR